MLIAVLFSRQFYFSFSHNLEYFSQIGSLPLLLPLPPPLSLHFNGHFPGEPGLAGVY